MALYLDGLRDPHSLSEEWKNGRGDVIGVKFKMRQDYAFVGKSKYELQKEITYQTHQSHMISLQMGGTLAWISSLSGTCGMCLLSSLGTYNSRDYPNVLELVHYCLWAAKCMGYSQVYYTGKLSSTDLHETLEKAGFKYLKETEVLNRRSRNVIGTWVINI